MEGTKSFHSLKGGGARNVLPVLRGGHKKLSDPQFSHFVAPLPIINDQSLNCLIIHMMIMLYLLRLCPARSSETFYFWTSRV